MAEGEGSVQRVSTSRRVVVLSVPHVMAFRIPPPVSLSLGFCAPLSQNAAFCFRRFGSLFGMPNGKFGIVNSTFRYSASSKNNFFYKIAKNNIKIIVIIYI